MVLQYWFIWLIVGIIFLVLEIFTPGFVVSIIGAGLILTGIFSLIVKNLQLEIIFFIITLVLLFVFLRPLLLKFVSKGSKESNVFSLVGKECLVEEEINNLNNSGYVKISGDHWKARSTDDSVIPVNNKVRVERIEGNTLYVISI